MKIRDFIIEIGAFYKEKEGNSVCGDTFLSRKVPGEERYVAVLSDGLGSGIRANVLSTLTAAMNLNFRLMHEPVVNSAEWVMDTLPIDPVRGISYSTFTIIDIDFDGDTTVIEYGNPSFFLERDGSIVEPERETIELDRSESKKHLVVSNFTLFENDRLVVVSDGVTQSGIGNVSMPFGWGEELLADFVTGECRKCENISAARLAKKVIKMAEVNDSCHLKDDASCAVIYRRKPRKLLICSGPPFDESKDSLIAETVTNYNGKKVICGGTTAEIISRELNKEIVMGSLDMANSFLPPCSSIDGIDLVTEGILTLGKIGEMLELMSTDEIHGNDSASKVVKMLLDADIVQFLVGTSVNVAHQDPSLPVELDIRRNVIKKIVKLLEEKYLKQVSITYL